MNFIKIFLIICLSILNKNLVMSNPTEPNVNKVLNVILKYLNTKDLCRSAAVCKSWENEVKEEFKKRTIQSIPIEAVNDFHNLEPYVNRDSNNEQVVVNENNAKYLQSKHVSDGLRNLPYHTFIFYDDKFPNYVEAADSILNRYSFELQLSSLSIIEVLGLSINDKEVKSENNQALGIFIPSTPSINVNIYCPEYRSLINAVDNPNLPKFILKKLNPNENSNEHHCFIMFNLMMPYEEDDNEKLLSSARNIVDEIKSSYQPGTFTIWGANVNSIRTTGCDAFSDVESCWFGMKLSGQLLKTYSIAIDVNLSKSEISEKLKNFKSSIEFKKNTIAFALVPTNEEETFDERLSKTEVFRNIFKNINLSSIYNTDKLSLFSTPDNDSTYEFENHVAYLVITHDNV